MSFVSAKKNHESKRTLLKPEDPHQGRCYELAVNFPIGLSSLCLRVSHAGTHSIGFESVIKS